MRVAFLLPLTLLASCASLVSSGNEEALRPRYDQPLADGQRALVQVTDLDQYPDLGAAWRQRDLFLRDAIDKSIGWFEAPSSHQWFPLEGITHTRARTSVIALRTLLEESASEAAFTSAVTDMFNVYRSVGYDGDGTVLFTAYYAPDFHASTRRSRDFAAPLYRRPGDLVTDPGDGTPLGQRRDDGSVSPYPTRAEIEREGLLDGDELVYLRDSLDAYIVHVNGSARLRMDDGTIRFVGYDGKTDRPYTGLGTSVVDAGLLTEDALNLRRIRRLYDRNRGAVEDLMRRNESFVFFREYDGNSWPSGSLGVAVTAERSVATDKRIFPRGGLVLVDTTLTSLAGQERPFTQFMLDQDTGGAIRAPGRADLFLGVGPTAGIKAGNQYAEGRLYYLFLKSDRVASIE